MFQTAIVMSDVCCVLQKHMREEMPSRQVREAMCERPRACPAEQRVRNDLYLLGRLGPTFLDRLRMGEDEV